MPSPTDVINPDMYTVKDADFIEVDEQIAIATSEQVPENPSEEFYMADYSERKYCYHFLSSNDGCSL